MRASDSSFACSCDATKTCVDCVNILCPFPTYAKVKSLTTVKIPSHDPHSHYSVWYNANVIVFVCYLQSLCCFQEQFLQRAAGKVFEHGTVAAEALVVLLQNLEKWIARAKCFVILRTDASLHCTLGDPLIGRAQAGGSLQGSKFCR